MTVLLQLMLKIAQLVSQGYTFWPRLTPKYNFTLYFV